MFCSPLAFQVNSCLFVCLFLGEAARLQIWIWLHQESKRGRKRGWMDEWMHRWVDVGQSTVQPTARACASVHAAIFYPLAPISLIATEETDASSRCGDARRGLMLNFRCAWKQCGDRRADGTGGEKNRLRRNPIYAHLNSASISLIHATAVTHWHTDRRIERPMLQGMMAWLYRWQSGVKFSIWEGNVVRAVIWGGGGVGEWEIRCAEWTWGRQRGWLPVLRRHRISQDWFFFFLASNNCRLDYNKADRREYKMMAQLCVSFEQGFSPLQVPSTLVCVQHFLHSARIQNEFVFL